MVGILITCLALFSGATTAFEFDGVSALNATINATTLELYPSIVQVDFLNIWGWPSWTQRCSATILNSRNVLSAASCFSGIDYPNPQFRRIRAGANFRNVGGMIVYVDREINYQSNFTNSTIFNDISVVRLSSSLFFSNVIQQSPIPAPNSIIPNNMVLSQVGWGPGNLTSPLSSAVVVISRGTQTTNTTNIITASPSINATSNIDIGGPWIFRNITIGIISRENRFGNLSQIVAASVAAYTNWIVRVAV